MRSSHVGSFPLEYSLQNVKRVLEDLAFLGVDVPSYPQLRGFVDIYVSPLVEAGVVSRAGNFMKVDPSVLSTQVIKNFQVPEAEFSIRLVREAGLVFSELRAPVTGVFTLASRLYLSTDSTDLSSTILASKELVEGFLSGYVSRFVRYLASLGFGIVFLDEPLLGLMIGSRKNLFNYSDDEIIEILESVVAVAGEAEIGIHVCGRIHRRLLELLARTDKVRYLSFEFHDNPRNLEVLDKKILEEYDKIVSPGVVSSRIPVVEDYDEVLELLKKVYEKCGGRIDLVSADCGFAGLKGSLGDQEKEYKLSLSKIEKIVRVVKMFEKQNT
ncbi:MAG: methionine synthase [Zestosphaera sp.]